jgi:hypothetical protein
MISQQAMAHETKAIPQKNISTFGLHFTTEFSASFHACDQFLSRQRRTNCPACSS